MMAKIRWEGQGAHPGAGEGRGRVGRSRHLARAAVGGPQHKQRSRPGSQGTGAAQVSLLMVLHSHVPHQTDSFPKEWAASALFTSPTLAAGAC